MAEQVTAASVTPPTERELLHYIAATRGLILRKLGIAELVADFDEVVSKLRVRLYNRLIVNARAGDNPAAYVWVAAKGVVMDHISDVRRRRQNEALHADLLGDDDWKDEGMFGADRGSSQAAVERARLTAAFIQDAVGTELWEKVTFTLIADKDDDTFARAHRNQIAQVRRVANVVAKAMELADLREDAIEIDIAMFCLPTRSAEVILALHAGDDREVIAARYGLSPSTAKLEIERANKLLFHAMNTYDNC